MNIERNQMLAEELGTTIIPQTRGRLYRPAPDGDIPAGMCCLGVAIDLAIREGWVSGHWDIENYPYAAAYCSLYGTEHSVVLPDVQRAFGWESARGLAFPPDVVGSVVGNFSLPVAYMTDANDDLRLNFQEIKALIEARIALEEANVQETNSLAS